MFDKSRCDDEFIWNSSICKCECDKSCDIRQYSDYENCKYKKELIDKLVEECSENIDRNNMIHNATLNDYRKVCQSCTIYIVLLVIAFLIIIGICSAFFLFLFVFKKR